MPIDNATRAALAALSPQERTARLDAVQIQHDLVEAQLNVLRASAQSFQDTIDELHRLEDVSLIAGRRPADLFTDPALLGALMRRPWSPVLDPFAVDAFAGLAPGMDGYDYEHHFRATTVKRLIPKLRLTREQPIDELAAALTRIQPILAVDGLMRIELLEHSQAREGLWTIEMRSPTQAVLMRERHEVLHGHIERVLTRCASMNWGVYGTTD